MTASRRTFAILLVALISLGCQSTKKVAAKAPEPALTETQTKLNVASFDEIWTTIRDKHFDPKLNGVDWNAARAELRPKVENARTMSQSEAAMGELLHRLNQSHFAIIPASVYHHVDQAKTEGKPGAKATDDADVGNGVSGIDVRIQNGQAIVTRVAPKSAGEKAGVKAGWELTAVSGKPVAPIVTGLAEAIKSDSFRPAMQALTVGHLLRGDIGKSVTATFIGADKKPKDVKIVMQPASGRMVKFSNLPELPLEFDCKRINNVAVYSLNIFLDPPNVMPAFRACVTSAVKDKTAGFIIDLRGNPGGIGFMAVGMGNMFVSKPDLYLGQMIGRDGPGLKFKLDAQPIHYDGPLAVLVDECSISTSEILAGGLRDIGRAKIFGTRTAGAALPSIVVKLPNDDRFQYAVSNYISSGGKPLEGEGVVPDVVIVPSRADLLAGKDPILDAAVKWCSEQNGNH